MFYHHYKLQQGSALIVSLSILLVLTILGVSAMRNISLEEKMAGNMRDSQVAFEGAEAALRDGELYLETFFNKDDFVKEGAGATAFYLEKGNNPPAWTDENNWNDARVLTTDRNIHFDGYEISQSPQFMIQKVTESETAKTPNASKHYDEHLFATINIYQITARGFGVSPNSMVMLQSHYGVQD